MQRIYMIIGPTGRCYIGKTVKTVRARFQDHLTDVQRGSTTALACAIRKHGEMAFVITEICRCVDAREARACERGLIAQYGTLTSAGGYNLTSGGDGNDGWRPSETTRALWREQRAGKRPHEWAKPKLNENKPDWRSSPENVERMRQLGLAKRGSKISDEHREALNAGRTEYIASERGKRDQKQKAENLIALHRTRMATDPEYRMQTVKRLHAGLRAISPEKRKLRAEKRGKSLRAYYRTDEGQLAKQRRVEALAAVCSTPDGHETMMASIRVAVAAAAAKRNTPEGKAENVAILAKARDASALWRQTPEGQAAMTRFAVLGLAARGKTRAQTLLSSREEGI